MRPSVALWMVPPQDAAGRGEQVKLAGGTAMSSGWTGSGLALGMGPSKAEGSAKMKTPPRCGHPLTGSCPLMGKLHGGNPQSEDTQDGESARQRLLDMNPKSGFL